MGCLSTKWSTWKKMTWLSLGISHSVLNTWIQWLTCTEFYTLLNCVRVHFHLCHVYTNVSKVPPVANKQAHMPAQPACTIPDSKVQGYTQAISRNPTALHPESFTLHCPQCLHCLTDNHSGTEGQNLSVTVKGKKVTNADEQPCPLLSWHSMKMH